MASEWLVKEASIKIEFIEKCVFKIDAWDAYFFPFSNLTGAVLRGKQGFGWDNPVICAL